MTKFKVGDKIIIGVDSDFAEAYGIKKGDVLTVSEIVDPSLVKAFNFMSKVYKFKESNYMFSEDSDQCKASMHYSDFENTFHEMPFTISKGELIYNTPKAEKKFTTEEFKKIVDETVHQINELSEKKGGEYAGDDDRLANFRRNAASLGLTKEDIWSVYAAKHWDAVMQYVRDLRTGKKRERLEGLSGRCDDLIVYLLLMKAMIHENGD